MKDLDKLCALVRLGKISRRQFLAQATALGVGAATASSLIGRKALAAPKRGGRFRLAIGQGSTSDTLDPATTLDTYMQTVGHSLRNYLTEVDIDGQIIPELAEGWDVSDDAAQWTFKLRKGIEFHNGKTMDAEDVVASVNHHRGEESKSAVKGLLDPIVELKADGKDTVVFKLETGNADWPFIMSDYHIPVLPAKDGGVDWQSGVGTGGYVLEAFEAGVRTYMKRNPNYWKENRAYFDEAEVLTVTDATARTNALTTGEVDAINRVELKTAGLLAREPGINIAETSGTLQYTAPMRTDTPPFDDNNVRLAIKHAVDREALVQTILRGHGYLGNDHPIGRNQRYFADELEQRAYDPDKAKYYLKQAGLSSLDVKLSAADAAFAGAVDAAVLYKEHAAPANITIEVVREPNDGYWSDVWMVKPWCMCYWGGRPTEDWMFSIEYAADAKWNDSFWKHEHFNDLLVAARAELNESKRRDMYVEMQQIVRDEGGVVVPMFANYLMGLSDEIGHGEMASNWDLDGLRAVERWWFES